MSDYLLISADSHFVEPPGMWAERMDRKFRERAPHTVKGLKGREGEYFVCENIEPMPVAGFFGAGVPSQELPEHNKKGYDEAPISVRDPAYRLKDLDRDGVQAEVIYTSMGMPLFGLDDAELRAACFARLQRLGRRLLQLQSQAADSPGTHHPRRYSGGGCGAWANREKGCAGRDDLGRSPRPIILTTRPNTNRSGPRHKT